ncbi:UDP-N-acetyl-D-mannosamine dehydrogenase [Quadrisphaera sp. GCM10027208]|uniref:UDP-N-acetyl-D-mannosamine dehydrogenase n=1 Tax=Quadrisphaera sp. GCM10027208 TaxID=3273423 RepID=UPI00360619CD
MDPSGRLAVIGLGYIGLPTAAAFATQGLDVVGVDVNPATVEAVNRGEVPFVEPDLGVAVSGAVRLGRLSASTDVPAADTYILAVPTPLQADRTADLSAVRAATEALAPRLRGGELVILESTSPPGTTEQIGRWLAGARPDLAVAGVTADRSGDPVLLAHCPERVLPGRIMIEIVTNDRVIGGVTPEAAERAAAVYRLIVQGRLLLTDARTAELSKLAENAYRDVNIAFANELARVCERLGVDPWEMIDLANRHPRVNILRPGPGVGGHCIAVDPWFVVAAAPEDATLIRTARQINDGQPGRVAAHVATLVAEAAADGEGAAAGRGGRPVRVAVLGLAFKANVDDLRESPAVDVVERLRGLVDGPIDVVEPHVRALPAELAGLKGIELVDLPTALGRADVVVLLVDHDEFRDVPATDLVGRRIVDTRGLWRGSA